MSSGRFDDMLLMVAQETGSIQNLLLEFFGFLRRRTDFFVLAKPGDRVGFPPGACEKMIIQTYNKYREEYLKEHPYTPPTDDTQPQQATPAQQAPPPPEPPQVPREEPQVHEIPDYGEEILNKPIRPEEQAAPTLPPRLNSSGVAISTDNGAVTENYLWSQDIKDLTV